MRMISNESADLDNIKQKYQFDFNQGAPLLTSGSDRVKVEWQSISEAPEHEENDCIKEKVNKKSKLDMQTVFNHVAEFTKFKQQELKDSITFENRSSALSTALTETSQHSYFRFSLRSMERGNSNLFSIGGGSFVNPESSGVYLSNNQRRQSRSEVDEIQ